MKLSDTQRLIMSSDSQRKTMQRVLPANLSKGRRRKEGGFRTGLKEKILQRGKRAKDGHAIYGGAATDTGPYSLRLPRPVGSDRGR